MSRRAARDVSFGRAPQGALLAVYTLAAVLGLLAGDSLRSPDADGRPVGAGSAGSRALTPDTLALRLSAGAKAAGTGAAGTGAAARAPHHVSDRLAVAPGRSFLVPGASDCGDATPSWTRRLAAAPRPSIVRSRAPPARDAV